MLCRFCGCFFLHGCVSKNCSSRIDICINYTYIIIYIYIICIYIHIMYILCTFIHHASDFCSRKLLTFGHHSPSSRFASWIGIGSLGLHDPRSHQQQPLNLVQDGQDGMNKAKTLRVSKDFSPMILISYPYICFSFSHICIQKSHFPKSSKNLQVRGLLRAQPPTKRGEQR